MDGLVDGWIDGWMDVLVYGWMDWRMCWRRDGLVIGLSGGSVGGWWIFWLCVWLSSNRALPHRVRGQSWRIGSWTRQNGTRCTNGCHSAENVQRIAVSWNCSRAISYLRPCLVLRRCVAKWCVLPLPNARRMPWGWPRCRVLWITSRRFLCWSPQLFEGTCICTYTHIHIYTYTHTHIYIRTHI